MGWRRRMFRNLVANVNGFSGVGEETGFVLLSRIRAGGTLVIDRAASVWITDLIVRVVSTHTPTDLKHSLGLRVRNPFSFTILDEGSIFGK
jgi:hypothetical protein